jgi:16S rRNA processing protein RimM
MLEVGRVIRPHGLRGEVVVDLVSNRPERSEPGACFATDSGELRIERSRPFAKRWIVTFADVNGRQAAEALVGTRLLADPIDDSDALWVHQLVGSEVVEAGTQRRLGTVTSVLANPASDLLELDGGALVPVRFILEHGPGHVVVDIPAGLIDSSAEPDE